MINSPSHQHQHQHFSSSCRLTSHPTSRFSFNQSPTSNLQTHPFYSIIVKFSTSIILALAGTVISATPHSLSRRVADPTGVQDAITQWLADIAQETTSSTSPVTPIPTQSQMQWPSSP